MADGLQALEQDVADTVRAVAREAGFKKPTFNVTAGSNVGDNFIGVMHRVKVEEEVEVETPSGSMSLIVKCQPSSEAKRTVFRSNTLFEREALAYNVIWPAFRSFQEAKGVPTELCAPTAAQCHHAGSLLILEDMCARSYRMQDRLRTLDAQHCSVVLRALGRLHAVSLAMRDQQPAQYQQLTSHLQDTFVTADQTPGMLAILDAAMLRALDMFTEDAGSIPEMQRHVEALRRYHDDYVMTSRRLVDADSAAPHAVVNHGDCWTNNILFKYDDDEGVAAVCLLDFQIVRHASPVCDVAYFIYCCTDQRLRDEHYERLIDEYYDSLAEHVRRLGSNPDIVFPRSALQDQLTRFMKFGIFMAAITMNLFTCDASEIPDVAAMVATSDTAVMADMLTTEHKNVDVGRRRMRDVVMDLARRGYFE